MSLRARILALGVGSAAAMLLLLAVPVTLTVQRNVQQDEEQWAASVAQGVADLLSTGRGDRDDLVAVVERIDARDGGRVTVDAGDGAPVGSTRPDCSVDSDARFGPLADAGTPPGRRDDARSPDGDSYGPPDARVGRVYGAEVASVDGGRLVRVVAEQRGRDVAVCSFVPSSVVGRETLEQVGVLGLAGRIDELLVAERETVADLSHRLRTPVTAVRLDVEALPESPQKRELEDHLDHLERTLTAVIQAARRPQREGAVPRTDVVAVVQDRFAYWAPLLEDQRRDAVLELPDGAAGWEVRLADADLAAALDALLENAVAHTAEGVPVAVTVSSVGTDTVVEVRDQGPGVPPSALRRGTSDRGSSGLGLDIARSCAEASGGRLELDRDGPWSLVRLVLGAP
ncbi:HAMP domain-containing sensor histidine kinase [Aeromicrobium sp. REDSEA-S32_B7]|uniref:sensor histidine kinase n=1 Tax=Aeromicrobium sp. REDSEA-S32_B7 TaxID=1811526 RepID=UPI000B15C857|nr:HAMP domain-containing sensor histidine kinase [Aeromicrobium sp. REDSEA-S32_B7]